MKKTVLIIAILLTFLLVACSNQSIIGKWRSEINGDEIVFQFNADGTMALTLDDVSVDGTFTIEDNKIFLQLFGEVDEGTFQLDGNTLMLTDSTGETIVLTKVFE